MREPGSVYLASTRLTLEVILDFMEVNGQTLLHLLKYDLLIVISGHVHITDFNIATLITDNQLATSMSGTTPYMGRLN
jgi:serine/threonine kinase 32